MAQSRHFTDTFTQQEAAIRISTKLQINRIQRAEEKLPDNKHFVIRICIQPGVLKSNCPEKKKNVIQNTRMPFTGLEPVFLVLNANEQKSASRLRAS